MAVPEGEPRIVRASSRADDRQAVGQARAMPHPLARAARVEVGEEFAALVEQHACAPVVRRGLESRELHRAREAQAHRHRVDHQVVLERHHRMAQLEVRARDSHVVPALGFERDARAELARERTGPRAAGQYDAVAGQGGAGVELHLSYAHARAHEPCHRGLEGRGPVAHALRMEGLHQLRWIQRRPVLGRKQPETERGSQRRFHV